MSVSNQGDSFRLFRFKRHRPKNVTYAQASADLKPIKLHPWGDSLKTYFSHAQFEGTRYVNLFSGAGR